MKLKKTQIQDIHALTPTQEGMLYYYLSDPSTALHIEQVELALSGELEEPRFRRAWEEVVKANPVLRSVFRWEGVKEPVQVVLKEHKPDIRYYRLGTGERGRTEPFDLTEVPFRVSLYETGKGTSVMVVEHHHILYDGWSTGIILKEFQEAYSDPLSFKPPLKALFRDYVHYVRSRNEDREDTEKRRKYWSDYLEGYKPDRGSQPKDFTTAGTRPQASVTLEPGLSERLKDYTAKNRVTTASVIYAAWGVYLQQVRGTADEVFDITRSGRNVDHKGIENTVGMLSNTQPHRVDRREGESNRQLVERVQGNLRRQEGMGAPQGDQTDLKPDTLAVIENYPMVRREAQEKGQKGEQKGDRQQNVVVEGQKGDRQQNVVVEGVEFTAGSVHEMMLMAVLSEPEELRLSMGGDRRDEGEVAELLDYYVGILDRMVTHPDQDAANVEPSPVKMNRSENGEEENGETRQANYSPPRTTQERRLTEIWSRVLGREKVGIDDHFFEAGGHSLKASKLAAAVYKEYQVRLPLTEIFKNPTIRQQARYIAENAQKETYRPIEPVEEKEYYPLTSAQKRMYMHSRLSPSATVYNGVTALRLDGELDIKRMENAFNSLIQRHEAFRTMFDTVDGEPVQRIKAGGNYRLQITNYRQEPENDIQITNVIENRIEPFDLTEPPLLRVELIRRGELRYGLVVDMHHIVTDGVSEDIVITEFMALYRGETLPPRAVRYRDYAQRQQERLESGELERQAAYWREQYAKPLPELHMPLDFPRPPLQTFEGDTVTRNIEGRLYREIRRTMQETGTTLFMVLLAVYNIELSRYTGQSDIIVGTVTEGREHPELQGVVGLFVETLAIRSKPEGQKTFNEFLGEVKETALQAYQNQEYPFREQVKQLRLDVSGGRNPLFDVMLVVQNYGGVNLEIEGLKVEPMPLKKNTAKLDLYLEAWEKPASGEIELKLEYSVTLFKRETVERFLNHYVTLLEAALDRPSKPVSELEMLTPGEILLPDSVRDNKERLEADFDF